MISPAMGKKQMPPHPHDQSELEHVEEVGFYWVAGVIAVALIAFAAILLLAFPALRGFGALLGGS